MSAPAPPEEADPIPATIRWAGDHVALIDQRRLPGELVEVTARTVSELCELIRTLAVRGAPALGAAGALGVALAARRGDDLDEAAAVLVATRPTAVNLRWGVDRALAAADPLAEALALIAGDIAANRAIGAHGAALVEPGARALTHCNAGALATCGYGTAIGVLRSAHDAGRLGHVWVDETRPVLQGSRLTAWELGRLGIPHTLVPDAAAASLFAAGEVDLVVVGADRIAADGSVANKVGTYGLAVLAHHHGVPFYVAAPRSTFDPATATGADIAIEDRPPAEVTHVGGTRVAPEGVVVRNPAFDVTPPALVTAYIAEDGVTPNVRGAST
jgi:methylthioribose-1-phosphate isomerase